MNLQDWRRRIDEIDRKLVELLNERSRCALEIGKLKQAANLPLYQPEREGGSGECGAIESRAVDGRRDSSAVRADHRRSAIRGTRGDGFGNERLC